MHLVAVLVRELHLRRYLHIPILLLADEQLLIGHVLLLLLPARHRAARPRVAILGRSRQVCTPRLRLLRGGLIYIGVLLLLDHESGMGLRLGLHANGIVFERLGVVLR